MKVTAITKINPNAEKPATLRNFTSDGENCRYVIIPALLAVNHSFTFKKMIKVRIKNNIEIKTLALFK